MIRVTCDLNGDVIPRLIVRHVNEQVRGSATNDKFFTSEVKIKLRPAAWRRKHPRHSPIERVTLVKFVHEANPHS